ncbi:Aste57867_25204 [Aphanomyces stellatus]|uniref:Aste57867_25204 protein n=1 Tax=Aphanomyces stellatus TaxID=120398 RepID=A0A485LSN2_9STRA|nr:hypothetical protein As57867_025126 [Aphanomyces stellatus]VFU01831.1 Aste57867_25204 [Aphanomyces stellatus]
MSEDPKKATKNRPRYRKKTAGSDGLLASPAPPLDDIDSMGSAPPPPPPTTRTPKNHSKPHHPKGPKNGNKIDDSSIMREQFQDATVLDAGDIMQIRRNREQQLNRQREHHREQQNHRKQVEEEKRKRELREKQRELMVKRVEEETVNKLVRAEVMFTLLQEHKDKTKPPSHHHDHPDETYPFGFNPSGVAQDVLVTSIKKWEEHLKRLLGGHRVADHERGIACLRAACRDAYCELLLHHASDVTLKMDFNERLWMNWYKEIDPVQSKLRAASSNLSHKSSLTAGVSDHARLRDAVTALLATATAFYNKLFHGLTAAPQSSSTTTHSIHMTLVALGDLARYSQNTLPTKSRSWRPAEAHYTLALQHNPSNGKVYNQLALLALHEHRVLDATYLYCRSLACATPFCARENLLTTLGSAKPPPPTSRSAAASSLQDVCSAHLLQCLSRLFLGIDIARLDVDVAAAVDSWRAVVRSSSSSSASHRAFFLQAVVLALFSVHNCQVPIGGNSALHVDLHFHTEYPRWHDHDTVVWALRFAFALVTGILRDATFSDAALLVVTPPLTLFLDWLRVHSWYFLSWHDPVVADFRAALAEFLPRVADRHIVDDDLDVWDASHPPLWEDSQVRGFLPLAKVTRCSAKTSDATTDHDVAPRVARIFGFVAFAADHGFMPRFVAGPNPTHVAAISSTLVVADSLCPQCSNSIAGDATMCEFCGYDVGVDDDDDDETSLKGPTAPPTAESSGDAPLARRGMLSGVNWNTPKPTSAVAPRGTNKLSRPSTRARHAPFRQHVPVDFHTAHDPDWKCLVVVDAANVAMRHGLNAKFSCRGIRLVFDYYLARGHKVIAFLPDYLLKYESVGGQKRMASLGFDVSPTKLPDDVTLLQAMVLEGLVIATPPQDYDDSYCIQYAGTHDGCLVTNDLFRDHLENIKGGKQKGAMREWLKNHRISFTWVGDEFFPNPDFRFPPKQSDDELLDAPGSG